MSKLSLLSGLQVIREKGVVSEKVGFCQLVGKHGCDHENQLV